jgi:four helix bundle protein
LKSEIRKAEGENMKTELEGRTLEFALRVISLVDGFPKSSASLVIGRQLLKSATSLGANYREANRAESKSDFIHKVGIAEKEASETEYWLLICQRAKLGADGVASLLDEARQLLAILTTIGRKAKKG